MQNIRSSNKVRIPSLKSRPITEKAPSLASEVDIIVPVYSGLLETQNCIQSVLNATYKTPYEIIVINDAGPDSTLNEWLRDLANQQKITLYENSVNLGFVGTVNKGMKLHPKRDVILLNSDTIVANNWLDRLKDAAYRNKHIATVTPFSNNASILSFPKPCYENSLPTGFTIQEVDHHFKEQNTGIITDLPTAHGYCMFIRRAALNQIGYFDEELWGRGYAEENDFSLRAAQAGWRNVLAADTFVQHVGSVSFSSSAHARIQKNLAKLNLLYPDYEVNVHHFIAGDPLFSLRNKVALSLLKDSCIRLKTKFYLFISHSLGGGTEVHTNYMAERLEKENIEVLLLKPDSQGRFCLENASKTIFVSWNSGQFDEMVEDLTTLNIEHIHYHHWLGFDNRICNLPKLLNKQFDITLHDYYTVCPRVNMVTETHRFCDSANITVCNACLAKNPPHSENKLALNRQSLRIQTWRKNQQKFLDSARQVYAPSHDTAERINSFLNLDNLQALYHPEPEVNIKIGDLKKSGNLLVAVPGGISRNKGFDKLISCASYAAENNLPIDFIVIGYSCDDKKLTKLPNVTITGRYQRNQFSSIARKYKCNVSVLFSLWPETYGYTLTESVNAGMPVLSFDIGAYAERIKKLGVGRVLSLEASDQKICEALIDLSENFEPLEVNMGNLYPSLVSDYYQLGTTPVHKKTA
ncbi:MULTISPECIES: glycosyltransferase [unclassified Endozoicomonas]|uniref:glycosyltransferase n=1 Tax=unclassified Endozoicomonas TaxID=2644528 RepID=UPI003BB5B50D